MKVFEICGESYVLADDARAEIEKLKAENERLKAAQNSLFDAIKHGDKEHQDWLFDAINQHFGDQL